MPCCLLPAADLRAGDGHGLGDAEADEVVLVGGGEAPVEVEEGRDAQVVEGAFFKRGGGGDGMGWVWVLCKEACLKNGKGGGRGINIVCAYER